ncbi:MAG: DUF4293 domain-containing protein [Bacteroidetes bacterium]|nr:DUF4293 domain-containing protein [Rhodothermia bacterium]MCX7907500.1 DUF4293 domain-containing protein [Bacteroidota bacterium]
MWQRVQTLYLLVANLCLLTLLSFAPVLAPALRALPWIGWLWWGLPTGALLLASAAIGVFRNRRLQMVLVRLAAILTAGAAGLSLALIFNLELYRLRPLAAFGVGILPIMGYLLLSAARRAIWRDEQALQRTHRLR